MVPRPAIPECADDHVISGKSVEEVQQLASVLEKEIGNNGLVINEKKKIEKGLTVAPNRQLVHAIAVNHPARTRINREYADKFTKLGQEYVRVAMVVSAISLEDVATIRRPAPWGHQLFETGGPLTCECIETLSEDRRSACPKSPPCGGSHSVQKMVGEREEA